MKNNLFLTTALVAGAVMCSSAQATILIESDTNLNENHSDGVINEMISSISGKTGTLTTSTIKVTNNSGRAIQSWYENSHITLGNEETTDITLTSASDIGVIAGGQSSVKILGQTVTVNANGVGIYSLNGSTVDVTGSKNVNVKSADDNAVLALAGGAKLNIFGQNVTIENNSNDWAAVHAGNNTTTETGNVATVNISADNITIKGTDKAVAAMSQGIVNLVGNTTISAEKAIVARGDAHVNINKAGDKVVKIDGNVDFNYDKATSGTKVDAYVDITLAGSESYWNGNTQASYGTGSAPSTDYMNVTQSTLTLKDGAVWNAAKITEISGETEGVGYAALNNLNIYTGTVNIADTSKGIYVDNINAQNATFSGGPLHINNTMAVSGDLNLNTNIYGGAITFASGSNLNVKAGEVQIASAVTNQGATLNLNLDNSFTGTYKLVDGEGASLDKEFTIAGNTLYNINTTDVNGTYEISKKSSEEVAAETGASQNQAATVTAVTSGESSNATFNAIAENISDLMQSGGAMGVQLALEAAETLAPEVAPVVAQTASENTLQVFNAVSTRLSGGSATPANRGMSSGDLDGVAVWAQGLYNHAKLDNTRKARGYDADSEGMAFGLEKQLNSNVKAGIGYAYTHTDIDGHNRDLDVDTHTALAYAEYKPSAWFVNAVASYSWSDYDEDKRILGRKVTGDYDAQSYALQAMTGYEMAYNNTIFTPETGLRYIHVSQDGYKDTAGQYVYGSEVDTLTGIFGIRAEQAYELDNGWTLRPQARLAYTYDIANDNGNSIASLANGAVYSVTGEPMKRSGLEADVALTADITDSASISLGYQGKFRDHYKDHTGLVNFRYEF